jgi:hypothetical protein
VEGTEHGKGGHGGRKGQRQLSEDVEDTTGKDSAEIGE